MNLPFIDFGGDSPTAIAAACALTGDGNVLCWGELGVPEAAPAAHVSLGVHFSCAAIEHRNVACWGANHSGQLGYQP
jgi:hypothetical protein